MFLPLQTRLANLLVACVVAALVLVQPVVGGMQRPMGRGVGQYGHERLVAGLVGFQVVDQLVGVELTGVKALGHVGHLAVFAVDCLRVVGDDGVLVVEVAGTALHQDERTVEAARLGAGVFGATQVPLARGVGVVAGVLEHLPNSDHALVQIAFVAGFVFLERLDQLAHVTQAGDMAVGSGEHHGAGR
ncbi:hypothetical protein D3C76_1164450 [compost metagenome]